ncbi:MAG: pyridoxamine 5'-phosphate oxidase [Gammaproteobacteria bacterium]|jgi:pyridoxamine 5'-phosphate oxidase|nr:pyridoxamine 5'-phosphate oxidase [Gammaproteobacteria bacterium]
MNADEYRRLNMSQGLRHEDLHPDPVKQFEQWFEQAGSSGIPEPNAMVLATVDEEGQPWARTVLVKLYDAKGFVFFTNFGSRKARHIQGNGKVVLLFPWIALGRQVTVTGEAQRISAAESMRYFATRPRGSQIGAWASAQSQVISSRSFLEARLDEMKQKFAGGEVPLPEAWGGYRVVPSNIEFWQAREYRLHDRFIYRRRQKGWDIERLAP